MCSSFRFQNKLTIDLKRSLGRQRPESFCLYSVHNMQPVAIYHDSAYAKALSPPPPVMLLVSATNLHHPSLRTLVLHEDLNDATPKVAKASVKFKPTAPPSEVKPAPPAQNVVSSSSSLAPPSERESPLSDLSDSGDEGHPNPSPVATLIPRPTGLTRKVLSNHPGWEEDSDITAKITVCLAFSHQFLAHFFPGACQSAGSGVPRYS